MGAAKTILALRKFMGAGDEEAVTATLRINMNGPCLSQATLLLSASLRNLMIPAQPSEDETPEADVPEDFGKL